MTAHEWFGLMVTIFIIVVTVFVGMLHRRITELEDKDELRSSNGRAS